MRYRIRTFGVSVALCVGLSAAVSGAAGAVTPGWECVPAAAGQAVLSGGTGASPACGAGTTAVLAPTFVSSGAGAKPTVEFAAVNVQILNGSGSTTTVNGTGNLVLGYDETPGVQTGSHDLVLGEKQTFRGAAELVAGTQNNATANFTSVFGINNKVSAPYALAAGDANTASGTASSTLGGYKNTASSRYSAVSGGCSNVAGTTTPSVSSLCTDTTSDPNDFASVSGGLGNQASGIDASVSGGNKNVASGTHGSWAGGGFNNASSGESSAVAGGASNSASGADSSISGGGGNFAAGSEASVSGGLGNAADGLVSSVAGGEFNVANDVSSFLGGGCDNLAGSGSPSTDTCDPGGEAIVGGSSITSQVQDSTSGFISDGVNVGQADTFKISLTLASKGCAHLVYGVPGVAVGDLPLVAYQQVPPIGLLLIPTGVTTAGQVDVAVCNESSATISVSNVPIRVQTLR